MAQTLPPLPAHGGNVLRVTHGEEGRDYVILMGKSHGGMRFAYASLDREGGGLAPQLGVLVWARLFDLVDFATCVYKNCLYVLGGRERGTGRLSRDVQKYDPTLGRWRQCGEMRKPRAQHAAVGVWGKLYVFGGSTPSEESSDTIESYEPLVDEWREHEERLPGPRKAHCCVATDDSVYLLGGTSPTHVANTNVWVLRRRVDDPRRPDSAHYEWSDIPDPRQTGLAYRLTRLSAAVSKGKLYVLGGVCHGQTSDGVTFIRRHVPCLDVKDESWGMQLSDPHTTSSSDAQEIPHDIDKSPDGTMMSDVKWHIGTTAVFESYKIHSSDADFSIDPDLEAAEQQTKRQLERQQEQSIADMQTRRRGERRGVPRQKETRQHTKDRTGQKGAQRREERTVNRQPKRQDSETEGQKYGAEQHGVDIEDKRGPSRETDERNERLMRMRTRTFWRSDLPNMPSPRCSFGTFVAGNKLFVVGGHMVEDESRESVKSVHYFHTRTKRWTHAFDLPGGTNLADIDCCVLRVPASNKEFKPMSYSACKWVLW